MKRPQTRFLESFAPSQRGAKVCGGAATPHNQITLRATDVLPQRSRPCKLDSQIAAARYWRPARCGTHKSATTRAEVHPGHGWRFLSPIRQGRGWQGPLSPPYRATESVSVVRIFCASQTRFQSPDYRTAWCAPRINAAAVHRCEHRVTLAHHSPMNSEGAAPST
jgi:hypothetical protein